MNNFYLYIILILSLAATSSYSQVNYLDTSFGDNGTLAIKIDSTEIIYLLGADSLNNIYLYSITFDSTNISSNSFSKVDSKGKIDYRYRYPDNNNKRATYVYNENNFINIIPGGATTVVTTYDLEFNQLGRYNIPDVIDSPNLKVTNDNGLQGLTATSSTFFRFNQDGTLNYDFGINGLVELRDKIDPIQNGIYSFYKSWFTDSKNNIHISLLTGIESANSITDIRLTEMGDFDTTFGNEGISKNDDGIENANFLHILFNNIETRDKGSLHFGFYQDTIQNKNTYYYHKINENGFPENSFGDTGILTFNASSVDSTEFYDNYVLLGELSNGTLAYIFYDRGISYNTIGTYLFLTNEQGVIERNFADEGFLDLAQTLPGYSIINNFVHNGEIYFLERDTIDIENVFLSKFDTDLLLDFIPAQPASSSSFLLYPNPVSDETIIEYNGPNLENLTLRIYNFAGQLIRDESISKLFNYQQIPINLSDASPGIYPVQIINNETEIWSTKIIIIK